MDIDNTLQEWRRKLQHLNQAIAALEDLSPNPPPKSQRGRKSMGHEERLVVSERMKRYWASKRQARTT